MITFIVTAPHRYTIKALTGAFGAPVPPCRTLTYDELFAARSVAPGTYIFTDMERLSYRETAQAAQFYRQMAATPGFRLLNDPARVRTRFGLLRALKDAGINDFDAWRADSLPRPATFPVFVRIAASHEPALTALLADQRELDEALGRLEADGHPLSHLVVIGYCAEPVAPGLYRRWGAYRIGGKIHLDHVVTDDNWNVKWGKAGLVGDDVYLEDDRAVRANDFADALMAVFEIAGIDYGRADFAFVGGRLQIYEINTNPTIGALAEHPSAIRMATMRFAHERFAACLSDLDPPEGGRPFVFDPARLPPNAALAYDEINALRDHQRELAGAPSPASRLRTMLGRLRQRWVGGDRGAVREDG